MIEFAVDAQMYHDIDDIIKQMLENRKVMVICKDYGEVTYECNKAITKIHGVNNVKYAQNVHMIDGVFGQIRFEEVGNAEILLQGLENVKVFFTPDGFENSTISLLMRVNIAARGSN